MVCVQKYVKQKCRSVPKGEKLLRRPLGHWQMLCQKRCWVTWQMHPGMAASIAAKSWVCITYICRYIAIALSQFSDDESI